MVGLIGNQSSVWLYLWIPPKQTDRLSQSLPSTMDRRSFQNFQHLINHMIILFERYGQFSKLLQRLRNLGTLYSNNATLLAKTILGDPLIQKHPRTITRNQHRES